MSYPIPKNMNHKLQLQNVEIFRKEKLLLSINASILGGEILAIMGPSGSGKSTLLSFIGGFLNQAFTAKGRIFLDQNDISGLPANKRRIGTLFQDDYLFPHLSITGNLMYAMPSDVRKQKRRMLAERALTEIGLSEFGNRDPASLSGGQRARVALIRVLLSNPRALLLDEAFSKLDMTLRSQIRTFVFEMVKECNLPVLMVTHDETDAKAAGGRIMSIDESFPYLS